MKTKKNKAFWILLEEQEDMYIMMLYQISIFSIAQKVYKIENIENIKNQNHT